MVLGRVNLLIVDTNLRHDSLFAFFITHLHLAAALWKAKRFSGVIFFLRVLSIFFLSLMASAQSVFHQGLKYLELMLDEVVLICCWATSRIWLTIPENASVEFENSVMGGILHELAKLFQSVGDVLLKFQEAGFWVYRLSRECETIIGKWSLSKDFQWVSQLKFWQISGDPTVRSRWEK